MHLQRNPATNLTPIYMVLLAGDIIPPTLFTGHNPAKSATNVSIATNIYFEIDDENSGVDSSTITVTIEGVNAILNGVFQSGFSGTITADGLGYNITINPNNNFSVLQVVNITLDADDLDGNSATQDVYSFTCANWVYPGRTQPSIVYNSITIYFPVPIKCLLGEMAISKLNVGLDGSTERVNMGYVSEMDLFINPVFDATFISDLKTFYKNWGGKRLYFEFTSGINSRYNGQWRLKPGGWRPNIKDGYASYSLKLERPAS